MVLKCTLSHSVPIDNIKTYLDKGYHCKIGSHWMSRRSLCPRAEGWDGYMSLTLFGCLHHMKQSNGHTIQNVTIRRLLDWTNIQNVSMTKAKTVLAMKLRKQLSCLLQSNIIFDSMLFPDSRWPPYLRF